MEVSKVFTNPLIYLFYLVKTLRFMLLMPGDKVVKFSLNANKPLFHSIELRSVAFQFVWKVLFNRFIHF